MGLTRLIRPKHTTHPLPIVASYSDLTIANRRRRLGPRPHQCLNQHLAEPRPRPRPRRPLHTPTSESTPRPRHRRKPLNNVFTNSIFRDIFDHAAQHGTLPTIHFTHASRETPSYFTCTIRMPHSDIQGTASSDTPIHAQLLAAIDFQRANTDAVPLPGRSLGVLTSHTASMFPDFCREQGITSPHAVQLRQDTPTCWHTWRFTPFLHGRPLASTQGATRDIARTQASLIAALALKDQYIARYPHLLSDFQAWMPQKLDGTIVPVSVGLSSRALEKMNRFNSQVTCNPSLTTLRHGASVDNGSQRPSQGLKKPGKVDSENLDSRSARMKLKLNKFRSSTFGAPLYADRSKLLVNQYSDQIVRLVANNAYSIVIGPRGSGKSTQVSQLLLESAIMEGRGAYCNIVCVNPSLLDTLSAANRVGEQRGELQGRSVGHRVQTSIIPPKRSGSIDYCVTTILVQQLSTRPDDLDRISHIIVDDVQEPTLNTDLLLICLKRAMISRAAEGKHMPKIILMGATVDERLVEYFRTPDSDPNHHPVVAILPVETHPVRHHYLANVVTELIRQHGNSAVMQQLELDGDDSLEFLGAELPNEFPLRDLSGRDNTKPPLALAAATIAHIIKTTTGGAVLVCLPGRDEMDRVRKMLDEHEPFGVKFGDWDSIHLRRAHLDMPDGEKKRIYAPLRPGCRKIIFTDVAEISITIPDVQFVVDLGRVGTWVEDSQSGTKKFSLREWASQFIVKQRASHAGRVRDGHFYALYPQSRAESLEATEPSQLIGRDLQSVCLQTAFLVPDTPVADHFATAVQSPNPHLVKLAMRRLHMLGLLDYTTENLTPLGHLVRLTSLPPGFGKMVVFGAVFQCQDAMIALASMDASSVPIWKGVSTRRARIFTRDFSFAAGGYHLASLSAFFKLYEIYNTKGALAAKAWADRTYISWAGFKLSLANFYVTKGRLFRCGLLDDQDTERLGANNFNLDVVKTLLVTGLFPNLARPAQPGWYTYEGKMIPTHDRIPAMAPELSSVYKNERLATYTSHITRPNDECLEDINPIPPLAALIFTSGKLLPSPGAQNSHVFELNDGLEPRTTTRMNFWISPHPNAKDEKRLEASEASSQILKFRENTHKLLEGAFCLFGRRNKSENEKAAYTEITRALQAALEAIMPDRMMARGPGSKMGAQTVDQAWKRLQRTRAEKREMMPRKKNNRTSDASPGNGVGTTTVDYSAGTEAGGQERRTSDGATTSQGYRNGRMARMILEVEDPKISGRGL